MGMIINNVLFTIRNKELNNIKVLTTSIVYEVWLVDLLHAGTFKCTLHGEL